jgi:hypothetical protein
MLKRLRKLTWLLALAAMLSLAVPEAAAAETVVGWATADGPGPISFHDHHLGRDSAAGPNGQSAVGKWQPGNRKGSYAGFGLVLPPGGPVQVEVLLAYHLTAPVTEDYLEVTLHTGAGDAGPLVVPPEQLSEHVGTGGAGTLVLDFTGLYLFTRDELEGDGPSVDLFCRRHGPAEGADLHLDAVALQVTVAAVGPFDLLAGDQAATLRDLPPLLFDVSSPVMLAATDCPEPVCYLSIEDADGADVQIAVVLMPDGESIRVGFPDWRLDGPVDPVLSDVVAPASAPADGTSLAVVEIDVRDSDDWPLGGGVEMGVDSLLLGPAEIVMGPVHQGNGTYHLHLLSASPGAATVSVEAEGVTLASAPTVFFETP